MRRTDLALEARELWRERTASALPPGAETETREEGGSTLEALEVTSGEAAEALGKGVGKYITIFPEALLRREEGAFEAAAALLGRELRALLGVPEGASVLVAGLGNEAITPDSLGPRTLRHVLATRHLTAALPETFGAFRRVAALATGVLGNTGMESAELVKAVAEKLRPDAVIAVDALCAREWKRLVTTVQLSTAGICPGSGVGNERPEITEAHLGVPVISIGVPTVVDAATLAADVVRDYAGTGVSPEELREAFGKTELNFYVTPKETDQVISRLGALIGYAVNLAWNDDLSYEDMLELMG